MRHHNLSFTYSPKIQPVRDGHCTWTTRVGCRFLRGDTLTLFGWSGKAYRTPWAWRFDAMCVNAVPLLLDRDGITICDVHPLIHNTPNQNISWADPLADILAAADGIHPATGEEWRNVLFGLNKKHADQRVIPAQMIQWQIPNQTQLGITEEIQ